METTNAMIQSRLRYIHDKTGVELILHAQNHGDGITWYTIERLDDPGRYFIDRRFRKRECLSALCQICNGIDLAQGVK